MSQANVKATDAIEAVKAALAHFGKQATDGLSEVDAEIRRTVDWVEHDRPAYWKERVRRAYDQVGAAKDDLRRCLTFTSSESHRPSCTEQRAALRKAQQHQQYCEEKQKRVKHWMREIAHELHEYQGRVTGLSSVIDSDVPAAIGMLSRVLTSIEEYNAGAIGKAVSSPKVKQPDADEGTNQAAAGE